MVIRFFHPRHNAQWPPTSKNFYPRFYPLHFLSYLYSAERASISLFNVECQTRELLVPFLLRLWYDAVLDWGLNPGPPALEASTLPLGYRGGGTWYMSLRNIQTSIITSIHIWVYGLCLKFGVAKNDNMFSDVVSLKCRHVLLYWQENTYSVKFDLNLIVHHMR